MEKPTIKEVEKNKVKFLKNNMNLKKLISTILSMVASCYALVWLFLPTIKYGQSPLSWFDLAMGWLGLRTQSNTESFLFETKITFSWNALIVIFGLISAILAITSLALCIKKLVSKKEVDWLPYVLTAQMMSSVIVLGCVIYSIILWNAKITAQFDMSIGWAVIPFVVLLIAGFVFEMIIMSKELKLGTQAEQIISNKQ